jgi:poly(A) polymerase
MIPKIYPKEDHGISRDKIDADALVVMDRLRQMGFTAYLVGGGVRDLLLGHTPKDFDISTSAKPEEVRKVFRNCLLIGRRFRLAHIRFGTKVLEVATFRSGDPETEALIIRDNEWGTPEQDVLRRDFTINGLFYNPEDETVIDYVDGYPDIGKRFLRTIGQPFLRFKQDPVRMIRLLKFQARFGLEIDAETRIAMLECRGDIIKSSQARILEELLRMLESGSSAPFFRLMTESGMLHLLLPALGEFLETPDGSSTLAFLEEIDLRIREGKVRSLDRIIPLSSLLFPLFEKHMNVHFVDRGRIPHLGQIQEEASQVVGEVFHPFFILPRRLKGGIVSVLTTQMRFTPLDKKRPHRLRIPSDPDFPLALQFLSLRAALEPGLKKEWDEWRAIAEESGITPHDKGREGTRRNPRRRRGRRR